MGVYLLALICHHTLFNLAWQVKTFEEEKEDDNDNDDEKKYSQRLNFPERLQALEYLCHLTYPLNGEVTWE